MERVKIHVSVGPAVQRDLRILAAQHGVRQGVAVAGLLLAARSLPTAILAQAMAASDTEPGELVPDDVSEASHVAQARALAVAPENF